VGRQIVRHVDGGGVGALVQHRGLLNVRSGDWEPNYQLRRATGTPMSCDLWPVCGELLRGNQPRSAAVAKNTSASESSVSSQSSGSSG
jgi:hypothetical protein